MIHQSNPPIHCREALVYVSPKVIEGSGWSLLLLLTHLRLGKLVQAII